MHKSKLIKFLENYHNIQGVANIHLLLKYTNHDTTIHPVTVLTANRELMYLANEEVWPFNTGLVATDCIDSTTLLERFKASFKSPDFADEVEFINLILKGQRLTAEKASKLRSMIHATSLMEIKSSIFGMHVNIGFETEKQLERLGQERDKIQEEIDEVLFKLEEIYKKHNP